MELTVVAVKDRATRKDFLRLPFRIYDADPLWVPPIASEVARILDTVRNPYFAQGQCGMFVCYRNGKPVARTAVTINRRHWAKFSTKAAFFRFFEATNDREAAAELFQAAARYAREGGAELLEGPFNPHHYSELGIQMSGFDQPPTFFQTYNPPYYLELLDSCGFRLAKQVHTRKNPRVRDYLGTMRRASVRCQSEDGFRTRAFDMKNFWRDLENVRVICNDAFSANWHFLPLTQDEYRFSARYLKLVTLPDLFRIVEYHGEPVGVLECVPDINPFLRPMRGKKGPVNGLRFLMDRKKARTLVVYAVGIRKAFQGTRVFVALFNALQEIAPRYDVLETSWMSEDNPVAIRAAQYFGMEKDKEFGIFERNLMENPSS
jgi:GNAT superfamily N-acetyltransferase